ncbi:hypothetical protein GCM10027414_04820 [Humibacter ginsengiterrae]
MVRSIVIPQDGAENPRVQELASIDEFQEVVGGWLEPIEIEALDVTVYMDESAERRHGPLNSRATALWWYFSSGAESRRFILGDVVVAGIDDGLGGADVPDTLVHGLFEQHRFVVQAHRGSSEEWLDTYARFDNLFDASLWCMLISAFARPATFRIEVEIPEGEPLDHHMPGGERPW